MSPPCNTPVTTKSKDVVKTIRRRQTLPNIRPVKGREVYNKSSSASGKHLTKDSVPGKASIKALGVGSSKNRSSPRPRDVMPRDSLEHLWISPASKKANQTRPSSEFCRGQKSMKQKFSKAREPIDYGNPNNAAITNEERLNAKPKPGNPQDLNGTFKILDKRPGGLDSKLPSLMIPDSLNAKRIANQVGTDPVVPKQVNISTASAFGTASHNKHSSAFSRAQKWAAEITIHGLDMDIQSPADFTKCITRSYPCDIYDGAFPPSASIEKQRIVQYLDIATKWFGVTQSHAEELFRIHTAFSQSVKIMLERQLIVIYKELRDQIETDNVSHSGQFTTCTERHLSFCRRQVTDTMAHMLYGAMPHPNITLVPSGLVALYLSATDCFWDYSQSGDPRDTSITLRIYYNKAKPLQDNFIRAAFMPDAVFFKNLNTHPQEGQDLVVTPTYQCNSVFRKSDSAHQVSYKTNVPWLIWDQASGAFTGRVPTLPGTSRRDQSNARRIGCEGDALHTLDITVTATIVENVDDASVTPISFERSVSTRLHLPVAKQTAVSNANSQVNRPTEVDVCMPSANTKRTDPVNYECRASEMLSLLDPAALVEAYEALIEMDWPHKSRVAIPRPAHSSQGTSTHPQDEPQPMKFAVKHLARKHASLGARLSILAQQHFDAEERCWKIIDGSGTSQHEPSMESSMVPGTIQEKAPVFKPDVHYADAELLLEDNRKHRGSIPSEGPIVQQNPNSPKLQSPKPTLRSAAPSKIALRGLAEEYPRHLAFVPGHASKSPKLSRNHVSAYTETVDSAARCVGHEHEQQASINTTNRYDFSQDPPDCSVSASQVVDIQNLNFKARSKSATSDLRAICLSNESISSQKSYDTGHGEDHHHARLGSADTVVDVRDERVDIMHLPRDMLTPPLSEKSDAASISASRLSGGSSEDCRNRSILASNNAVSGTKEEDRAKTESPRKKIIQKRLGKRRISKLVCPDCHRCDFKSVRGFINHCHIHHGPYFDKDDPAIKADSHKTGFGDQHALILDDTYRQEYNCRNQLRASDGISSPHESDTIVAEASHSRPKFGDGDRDNIICSGVDSHEQGMIWDSKYLQPSTGQIDRPSTSAEATLKLSKDEQWDHDEAKKRSLEEQTARKLAITGVSDDLDDIFDSSTGSDSEETWCASDEGPLMKPVWSQDEHKAESDEDSLQQCMHRIFDGGAL